MAADSTAPLSGHSRAGQLSSLDLPGPAGDTRIVVAMSGGVDSSVVAGLLARQGYEVIGVTLQLYDHGEAIARPGSCCAGSDIHDARRVASDLGIAHYVLDYETRFRSTVIDDFADSYLRGETPVPCIRCNQQVKFEDLLGMARDLGAQALATGHYAINEPVPGNGHRRIARAHDLDRDQSYFLFATTQPQLDFLRFPLGELEKSETRKLAGELGLGVAGKPDSQDICFVPDGRYGDVIERLRPEAGAPGDIVDLAGRKLGRHRGIVHYTIGQRRGLGLSGGPPYYVVAIDAAKRRVVVGPRDALIVRHIRLKNVNWLGPKNIDAALKQPLDLYARIRSTSAPVPARLARRGDEVWITLAEGEYGVSPGQACVLYDGAGAGAWMLGGGWIAETESGDTEIVHHRATARNGADSIQPGTDVSDAGKTEELPLGA